MKKLLLFCLAAGLTCVVSAQKVYFLYLQTDDLAPFYVRMGDKIFSSSTAGYLILPNLPDSTYLLGLGFAKSTQPETRFAVTINQNDKGYLVKSFSDGLSLFDMQELSIVKSVSASNNNVVYETKTDKFSSVLSKAADDPSLLRVPVAKKDEPKQKPDEKKEVITAKTEEPRPIVETRKDTTVADIKKTETAQTIIAKEEPVRTEPKTETQTITEEAKKPEVSKEQLINTNSIATEYKPSTIVRRSESSTTEGFGIVFLDKMENKTDTIRILIPPTKVKIDEEAPSVNLSEIEKKADNTVSPADPSKTEVKIDSVTPNTSEQKQTTENKTAVTTATPVVKMTTCKESASEKDFMKLRKNMAAENTDEDMIDEARKVFRNRCFTVEQIRHLSTLFLTSAAKYQFFDAAFNHINDKQNFASLQSEIKDEYYLKRFKALAGE
jgi:hypothetical protein